MVPAIDVKAQNIFPVIKNSKPYNLLVNIINRIRQEEEKIAQDVQNYKAQIDRRDRVYENALSKKRKIFGLDSNAFDDDEERENAIQSRIREVYTRRLDNAKRHYEASRAKYIKILSTIPDFVSDEYPQKLDYWWEKLITKNPFTYALRYDDDGNLIDFETFVDRVIETDTTIGAIKHIREVQLEDLGTPLSVREYEDWSYYRGEKYIDHYNYTFYGQILSFLPDSPCLGWIFLTDGEEFERGIDLIMQLTELKKQIKIYQEIVNSPASQLIQSFSQENGNWGNIMSQPAFIRYGRDHTGSQSSRWLYSLLMVKPGVSSFDFDKIKKYTRRNGYEFGRNVAERHENLKKLEGRHWDIGGRAISMLPSSLNFEQTAKIVNETLTGFCHKIFVVDDPAQAVLVKRIVYNYFISQIKQIQQEWEVEQSEIRGREYEKVNGEYRQRIVNGHALRNLYELWQSHKLTGVVVDKDYYKNFFIKTPTNKNLYLELCQNPEYKIKNIVEEFFDLLNKEYNRLKLYMNDSNIPSAIKQGYTTIYYNCIDIFKQIDWEKIDEEYLGGYSSFGINADDKAEFRSLIESMPQDFFVNNEPDYDADLLTLFDFDLSLQATEEEYKKALELGLIELEEPQSEEW